MKDKDFLNAVGNRLTLLQLCEKEPAWAANRILALTKKLNELAAKDNQEIQRTCQCRNGEWFDFGSICINCGGLKSR